MTLLWLFVKIQSDKDKVTFIMNYIKVFNDAQYIKWQKGKPPSGAVVSETEVE